MSLVPDYGDSDNSDQSDSEETSNCITPKNEIIRDQSKEHQLASNSSSDSDEKSNRDLASVHVMKEAMHINAKKLPVPDFVNNKNSKTQQYLPATSVFANPYADAENAKKSALEKHVKMVDGGTALTINGKKICWNYRKGRCRFGHNCKYAHDSDLHTTNSANEPLGHASNVQKNESVICQKNQCNQQRPTRIVGDLHGKRDFLDDSDSTVANNPKKKRPGLTQGLLPGKKVIRQYNKLKGSQN